MKSKRVALGELIHIVDERNKDMLTDTVLGISIDKEFIPSVANIIGTDLSNYKVVHKGRFACNPMHVGRDERLPVCLYSNEQSAIVSPAYFLFECNQDADIVPEYLNLCFHTDWFDKNCWLRTDSSVRGGISWDDLCLVDIPVPPIEEQRKIVRQYKVVTERISLLLSMSSNLMKQASTYFTEIFISPLGNSLLELNSKSVVPEGWSIRKVGNYCEANIESVNLSTMHNAIQYLDTGSLTTNMVTGFQSLNINVDEIPGRARRKMYDGDILYSTVRPNLKHYGIIYSPEENMVASTGFCILHNKNMGISNELIYMLLTHEDIVKYLQGVAENSVSTYPSIGPSDLLDIQFALPPQHVVEKANLYLSAILRLNSRICNEMSVLEKLKVAITEKGVA